jgi:hypothetical protein
MVLGVAVICCYSMYLYWIVFVLIGRLVWYYLDVFFNLISLFFFLTLRRKDLHMITSMRN